MKNKRPFFVFYEYDSEKFKITYEILPILPVNI